MSINLLCKRLEKSNTVKEVRSQLIICDSRYLKTYLFIFFCYQYKTLIGSNTRCIFLYLNINKIKYSYNTKMLCNYTI